MDQAWAAKINNRLGFKREHNYVNSSVLWNLNLGQLNASSLYDALSYVATFTLPLGLVDWGKRI